MASHNKKYDNNHAEVIIALKDKAGHIHELEDQYIREKLDAEILTRENMFNALSAVLQNLYDEDKRIEKKFDGVIKDKLQDYFVYLGEFDRSGQAENAAANISNLNLNHSTILFYIYDKTKVGIIYNFLRHDGFFQLIELQGTKSFRYFKWNSNKTSLTLQNSFEGISITAGWNNYTSKPFFEIANKNSGTPYLNIYPLFAGGIVSYNIETLINLVDKYSLYSENGSTKFTTEEIQNWTMPDSPTLLNIIKNLYEKNNTYKSLLTSATNTITTLRTDLNAANNKLSQVSDAQYNAKLQQDLAIQLLSQSHQSNIQYLQERLNLNFSQDEMRYGEQTGVDKRQNEIINELLSYHTGTISRGTPTQTQDISSNVLGMIDIPYNEEYMYIYDTNDENNINNDTLLVNSHYLHDVLCLYYPLNNSGDISNDISTIGNGKLILFRVIYNDRHYYYYYSGWSEKPEALPSPWPSGNDANWISFKSLNANNTIAQLYYGTCPISWGSTPQTIPQYSTQSTAVNTATEVQVPTGTETQTQTTPTQPITLAPTLGPTIGPTGTQMHTGTQVNPLSYIIYPGEDNRGVLIYSNNNNGNNIEVSKELYEQKYNLSNIDISVYQNISEYYDATTNSYYPIQYIGLGEGAWTFIEYEIITGVTRSSRTTAAQTTPRAAGAGTPGQDINTQTINTQTTPTQTINTRTLPISGAPVTPGRPTETKVQEPTETATQTQTTPTQAITLGPTLGPTIAPTETQTQTTPTQAITLGPTIGPTATLSCAQTTHTQTINTQTINTQTINTETMPAGPTRTIAPTETEVQAPTATETQTQTAPTQTLTSAPTGRPGGHLLPSNNEYQYVYEGMNGVNISESSVYINPAIYSNLPKDEILIKHSDESYEYCDFIGIYPDGVLSGYYVYNIRISDTSNIVTLPPQPTAILPAAARPPIPTE